MLQYPLQPMMIVSRWKPHVEIAPNCPRCASPNTKFCYYNNYSLSQPRYFCKGCRRYWTKGGSLRNVPVGGGCRKNRRSRPARSALLLSLADRVGLNYLRDLPSPTRSSSDSMSMSSGTGSDQGPAEIDMSDVFAKFLNQISEQNKFGEDSLSGTSCGSLEMPPSSFDVDTHHQIENFMMMECQIPSAGPIEEAHLHNTLVSQEDIQDFVDQHPSFYELQELLENEIPQDMAWKEDFSTLSWQQGFGQVSYNDQVKMATNLVTDDWSSMDLSSYGIFARPLFSTS